MEPFDPDATLLGWLGSEHENGTWIGPRLLRVANRIRELGGNEDDYIRWVRASTLWNSYANSTSDHRSKREGHLSSGWDKSRSSQPFELHDALSALMERIASHTGWMGRSGPRDRAVALAFVSFCRDRNCFTRTLSGYELAKQAGLSQRSVSRALTALADRGLISEEPRTDTRTSPWSAKRYRINLKWRAAPGSQGGVSTTGLMSTAISSLSHELPPPSDLWSRKGLGLGAQRVYEALDDEPVKVRAVADRTGMKPPSVKRYLKILAEHCLAGSKPGAPGEATLWFRVDTPLDAVADALGIYGHVEVNGWKIEQQQLAYQELMELGKAKRNRKPEPPAATSYEDTWRDRDVGPGPF